MARDTKAIARATPVDQSFIQRAAAGFRYMLTGKGPDSFFGPNEPIAPAAQEQAFGRQFDYPTGYNLQYRPRSEEAIDFPTLRMLADNYDLVRLAIETRKDQMGKLQWTINRKDGGQQDDTAKAIEEFLQEPDGEHDFLTWQRMLLEDLLVIDAPTVCIQPTLGGQPFALEPIDGATIKRVLDDRGRTPQPPDPAYQQIIKGLPAVDYTRDELLYLPRNQRTHKVYGFSPVEQIIMIVNIGLRREIAQLQFYTEGNVPDVFIGTPENWNPSQIQQFQTYWDEILAGDSAARRRARFIPGGMDPKPMREGSLVDPFDEWLARVICYAFNLPPNAFVKQQNRATAESAQEVALTEGLAPFMEWQVRFINRLIKLAWKTTDYVFAWQDSTDIDPMVQAQIDVLYAGGATGNGPKIRSIQEIRDDHDWGPVPPELAAEQQQKQDMAAAQLEAAKNPQPPVDPKQQQQQQDEKQQTKNQAAKLEGTLERVADRVGKLEERAAAPQSTTSPAQDFAALVEHGVPPNKALKVAGVAADPIDGGDVALVNAKLVPLAVATEPPPAPEPVEKRAPAAAERDVNVNVKIVEQKGDRTVTITKPNGEQFTGTVSGPVKGGDK